MIYQNICFSHDTPTAEMYRHSQNDKYESYAFMHNHMFALPNDDAIAPAMKNGSYEYGCVEQMKKILLPGDVVIDIGACIGLYSVVASKIVGWAGKVISIEPEINNIEILKYNLEINEMKNIDIITTAMSDVRGTMYLNPAEGNAGDCKLSLDSKYQKVSVAALDDITINNAQINFIKIDVQGNEVRVLRGAKKTIKRQSRIYMLIEFCPQAIRENGDSTDEFINLLLNEFKMKAFIFDYKEKTKIDGRSVTNFSKGYELLPVDRNWLTNMANKEKESGQYCDLWCCRV